MRQWFYEQEGIDSSEGNERSEGLSHFFYPITGFLNLPALSSFPLFLP
jgi:hypothetical protein